MSIFVKKKPYRVLTIDGGGVRGLYSAILLDTLNTRFCHENQQGCLDVGKGFDLIVGTSTGAIIGILLMFGLSTRQIVRLYRDLGPGIFSDPIPISGGSGHHQLFGLWRWVRRNWNKPADNINVLRDGLKDVLGDMTLAQAYQKRNIGLCVPAVNMATHHSVIFRTPHYSSWKRYIHYKLIDVLIASVSAPMLFPLAIIDDPDDPDDYKIFLDGGLWANNPVLLGMSEALRVTEAHRPIEIVSVGTCNPPGGSVVPRDQANWGLSEWQVGTRAFGLALETQSIAYNDIAQNLAKYLKQPCKIIRLAQSTPSVEQGRHILMDRATPDSLKVLSDLAKQDAENIFRQVQDKHGEEMTILGEIFTGMEQMTVVES